MADDPSLLIHLSNYLNYTDDHTWYHKNCLTLVFYVIKFPAKSKPRDTLVDLDKLAYTSYHVHIDQDFFDIFQNSFIPHLKCFFSVPKPNQLSDNDKRLTASEILAGFMDFLHQMLNTDREYCGCSRAETCKRLQVKLAQLMAIVDDIIFQCTHCTDKIQKQVDKILKELEKLANRIGSFVHSHLPILLTKDKCYSRGACPSFSSSGFIEGANVLFEKIEIFNANITKHWIRFQELAMLNNNNSSSRCARVDSFFIIDSLTEDLEEKMLVNSRLDAGIKGQIETLLDGLKFTKPFLEGIRMLQDTDEQREPLLQIRDIAYEAEYLIHSHVAGNIPIWYLQLRLPTILHKLKMKQKELEQIDECGEKSIVCLGEVPTFQPIVTPAADSYYFSKGFEDEKIKIMDVLTGYTRDRVVSIYGIAGLGKTTMASELYACRHVCNHFDRRVWCVVSQTYSVRELMIHIGIRLSIEDEAKKDVLRMEDVALGQYIHQQLFGRRYLIVLDDVWDIGVWDGLQRYFPDDRNGSRIMLTSRIKAAAPENSAFHTLPFLTKAECWDLLEKKVFQENPCPAELLGIGKEIASKCHGIPLTVVVTAGILVNLEKNTSVWERVEKHLDAYLSDDQNNYVKVLELSYKYLPHYLKPCFLYLGAFHEDTEISVKKLLWLWIAEGFIPKKEKKSLEEIAESYLLDLINRSLLLTTKWRFDRGIKACRVHDLLRDLCIRKADEENFLKSTNYDFSIYEKHQRLCVPSTPLYHGRPLSSHVRSFRGSIQHHECYLSKMALLRVMESVQVWDVPPLPIHLRYLGISHMPDRVADKLVNIEFLCIDNKMTVVKMPCEILQMVKLRHVLTKQKAELHTHRELSKSSSLRSLSFVGINHDWDEEVLKTSRLHTLKCSVGGKREFPVLSSLTELESLKVVFEFSPERTILSEANFASTIRKIHIRKSAFPWEKLSVLGKLPNLQVLKLGPGAFVGNVWVTREGEFKTLRFLKIEYSDPKEWTTDSEHFPRLERLVLAKCYVLSKIPSEIGEICTLKSIELNGCAERVYMSALEIEESQLDYGNTELQVLITRTDKQLRQKHIERESNDIE